MSGESVDPFALVVAPIGLEPRRYWFGATVGGHHAHGGPGFKSGSPHFRGHF